MIVGDKMKWAQQQLRWGDPADGNVGCAIGPGTEAVLFTDGEQRHEALVAKRDRQTPLGRQVLLESETLPTLEQSLICGVGSLALAHAASLA